MWELFDVRVDPSETHDLAAAEPERLAAMIELLVGGGPPVPGAPARQPARSPRSMAPRRPFQDRTARRLLARRRIRSRRTTAINVRGQTARAARPRRRPRPARPAEGVLLAMGTVLGGWSFHVLDGRLRYVSNYVGHGRLRRRVRRRASRPVPHELMMHFDARPDFSGTVHLLVDGAEVGTRRGRAHHTRPPLDQRRGHHVRLGAGPARRPGLRRAVRVHRHAPLASRSRCSTRRARRATSRPSSPRSWASSRRRPMPFDRARVPHAWVRARSSARLDDDAVREMRARLWTLLGEQGIDEHDAATWPAGSVAELRDIRRGDRRPTDTPPVRHTVGDLFGAVAWKPPASWGQALVAFPEPGPWSVPRTGWHCDYPFWFAPDEIWGVVVFLFLDDVGAHGGATARARGLAGAGPATRSPGATTSRPRSRPRSRRALRTRHDRARHAHARRRAHRPAPATRSSATRGCSTARRRTPPSGRGSSARRGSSAASAADARVGRGSARATRSGSRRPRSALGSRSVRRGLCPDFLGFRLTSVRLSGKLQACHSGSDREGLDGFV